MIRGLGSLTGFMRLARLLLLHSVIVLAAFTTAAAAQSAAREEVIVTGVVLDDNNPPVAILSSADRVDEDVFSIGNDAFNAVKVPSITSTAVVIRGLITGGGRASS